MPRIDDWAANPAPSREMFSMECASMDFITSEVADTMFPGLKLQPSPFLAYFPFTLCTSLPTVNKRGRAFTPRVLANSFASLTDQLIDLDHRLNTSGLSYDDRIIGHVKATHFEMPSNLKDAEVAAIAKPIPVTGLGCLFRRARGVEQIIQNHMQKKEKWGISMECGHKWGDAMFMYEGEFIPALDAEIAMKECVEPDHIRPYKGKQLSALLGGLAGRVEFWGTAFTQEPADPTGDVFNFIAANPMECASRKIFSMPLKRFSNYELEVAHMTADKMIEEVASLEIIGMTQPAEDGHQHLVLSNLTILPANGHSHSLNGLGGQAVLSRGTNPRLTGVTDLHAVYPTTGPGPSYQHLHLVDVPLKGKYKPDGEGASSVDESIGLSAEEVASMEKSLTDLLKSLEDAATNLSKATTDTDRNKYQAEIASANKSIAELNSKSLTEETKKQYVDQQIKDGKLLTKEVADQMLTKAIDDTKKELTEDFEKKQKAESVRNERIQKCIAAGIDMDVVFEIDGKPVQKDGKDVTVRDRVSSISADDETGWNIEFINLTHLFPPVKGEEVKEGELVGASANTGKGGVSSGNGAPAKRRIGALAGGGPSGGRASEVANTPKNLQGRHAIKANR